MIKKRNLLWDSDSESDDSDEYSADSESEDESSDDYSGFSSDDSSDGETILLATQCTRYYICVNQLYRQSTRGY